MHSRQRSACAKCVSVASSRPDMKLTKRQWNRLKQKGRLRRFAKTAVGRRRPCERPAKATEWRQKTRHGPRQFHIRLSVTRPSQRSGRSTTLRASNERSQHAGEINSLGRICGPASVRGRVGSSNQSDHGTEDRFGGCKDQCLGFRRPQPGLLGGGTDDCEDPKRAAPRQSRDRR